MNMDMIMGLVRHVLTFGGGFLVSAGYVSTDDLTAGVGAVATLVGIVWSAWIKKAPAA